GNVGIGTTSPEGSAQLEVNSTDKGFLPPRVANVNDVSNPVAGLQVYDQSVNCMRYYNGTVWSECMGKPFSFGDPFMDSRDGKVYNSVQIGTQCWMAENLNYETTNSWWYDNSSANGDIYGRLYTWEAAITACPSGWSLPSDDEWKTLEMQLFMSQSDADTTGWRGTNQGEKLKSTSGWFNNGNGIDEAGFKALPGGWRDGNGDFLPYFLGPNGYWWSATDTLGDIAWFRELRFDTVKVNRNAWVKENGLSVRCLRD
ncbi:MAG: hypothetical protein GY712_11940, partial [Oceanicoccus sp.]|uniref:fibrobacter succinogenes major paralogous domain-containing protein n=1 Tax=Oceanicoccus sp. TaxID=2691044 RepID=UPI002607673F